ncbi:PTS sugar transporter subunit IIA [Cellulomonas gilvus]|uniref:PTS system, glucose subfamily, IIA subunit n=1 Tax=Cellulomonas gilvus (strain ATCC 13127 / NRRL B-14078) TaxID=593907 RepID=F8A0L9_CELGA|nr:PTS glucose transporter subunit IIA [Cellulomonas gilvus]AEI12704.1 PTS system, glucose subfamily, IIA subunit [Cellulomonas gilvus ATCC 13127]
MSALRVLAPVPGTVRAIGQVPDPVFAQEIVGPGVAIEPDHVGLLDAVAPCDGVVGALHPHAFAIEVDEGRSVLVHLGIDTVRLAGLGFTLHVQRGDTVRAGQRMVTWSPVDVAASGMPTVCPVVALQADAGAVTLDAAAGAHVAAGDPLLTWG